MAMMPHRHNHNNKNKRMIKNSKTYLGALVLLLAASLMTKAQDDMDATASAIAVDSTTITTPDSAATTTVNIPTPNYIDEVVCVVGDEAILRSDIEMMRLQSEQEGVKWNGDPDCRILEQIAVQKLFLTQAAIDSIEVTESEIASGIEQQINGWIQMVGSREKLEEYRGKTVAQMRTELHDDFKNRELTQRMRQKLVENIKVTPADVRRYFKDVPEDSLPQIPTTVEVQIITQQPRIPAEEINKVKDELREYTERVNSGSTSFSTLARFYSEDEGSARQGGEIGYTGRGMLDPAFAQVAFNLTDPKRVSKIVESEFGFHIIQLIDKRGDKINCRHILRKPRVSQEAIAKTKERFDSLVVDLRANKIKFDDAATLLSDDKDTRSNRGIMSTPSDDGSVTSRFEMKSLPTEVARIVDTLKVGQVSAPFTMINSKGKTTVAIVKLTNRIDSHRATVTGDFQTMSRVVLNAEREKAIKEWVKNKIKDTYVRLNDEFKNCDFEYEGWEKE